MSTIIHLFWQCIVSFLNTKFVGAVVSSSGSSSMQRTNIDCSLAHYFVSSACYILQLIQRCFVTSYNILHKICHYGFKGSGYKYWVYLSKTTRQLSTVACVILGGLVPTAVSTYYGLSSPCQNRAICIVRTHFLQ